MKQTIQKRLNNIERVVKEVVEQINKQNAVIQAIAQMVASNVSPKESNVNNDYANGTPSGLHSSGLPVASKEAGSASPEEGMGLENANGRTSVGLVD